MALCAWWAVRAERRPPPILEAVSAPLAETPPETPPEAGPQRLDVASFEVALWNPPPKAAPPAPAVVERAEPLRLQLLGIVHTAEGLRAALYDPEDDRIHLVADGESIGRVAVVRVADQVVELADGRRTHLLRIREEEPAGGDEVLGRPGGRR